MTETTLALAQGGDGEAFRELTDPYRRELQVHCYRILGSAQDAEDVLQEVLLSAWRSIGSFQGVSTRAWLYRIATNCSLDLVRSRKRRSENLAPADPEMEDPIVSLPSGNPGPEREALSGEIRERVAEAMNDLSATERTAFVLRHFEGMCIEDVSRVLECQPGAAKHSVFRAVQKLRRALEPLVSTAR
jgi:RNA polymerase sigma-70 factor (ECF subfamily)